MGSRGSRGRAAPSLTAGTSRRVLVRRAQRRPQPVDAVPGGSRRLGQPRVMTAVSTGRFARRPAGVSTRSSRPTQASSSSHDSPWNHSAPSQALTRTNARTAGRLASHASTSRRGRVSASPPTADGSGRSSSGRDALRGGHQAAASSPRGPAVRPPPPAAGAAPRTTRGSSARPARPRRATRAARAASTGASSPAATASSISARQRRALRPLRDPGTTTRGPRSSRSFSATDRRAARSRVRVRDHRPQRVVHRPQLLVAGQLVLQRRHAAVAQPLGEAPPHARAVVDLAQLPEHAALVGLEADVEAALAELRDGPQVLQPGRAARGAPASGRRPARRATPSASASVRAPSASTRRPP